MNDRLSRPADSGGAGRYAIRLAGRLDPRWSEWFDGLTVSHPGDGTTVISGPVADQAALHGALRRVRDLGLAIVAVTRLEADASHPGSDVNRGDPA
jgi:hypothetical protein